MRLFRYEILSTEPSEPTLASFADFACVRRATVYRRGFRDIAFLLKCEGEESLCERERLEYWNCRPFYAIDLERNCTN